MTDPYRFSMDDETPISQTPRTRSSTRQANSSFSQFVNPNKRQRPEKKSVKAKRSRVDENQPTKSIIDRTYTVVDETQAEAVAIPDTLLNNDSQHNDSSWQRDIDRLMKKLEEPSCPVKSPTQAEPSPSPAVLQTTIDHGIQTDPSPVVHPCCQDVSSCPCVQRYSKLERLFMEKVSRFVSISRPTARRPRRRLRLRPGRVRSIRPETAIEDLSSIEKLETTAAEYPSTMQISSVDRRLVLTGSSLDESQKTEFRQFLTRFGLSSTSTVDSSTSHVIVSDNSTLICPLTGKIIQGIARHLFIVSSRWLTECLKEETIVDERPFEIRGDTSLGIDHGGMRRSRLTPSSSLLANFSICLRCSASDCAPLQNVEQVTEIIELCGGKLFHHFSQIESLEKERQMVLVLGLNGFNGGEKKRQALLDTCQQFQIKCVNIHWLLISIAKFEIQSFDTYDINQV